MLLNTKKSTNEMISRHNISLLSQKCLFFVTWFPYIQFQGTYSIIKRMLLEYFIYEFKNNNK